MSNVETGLVQKKREVRLDIEPANLFHVLRSLLTTYACHSLFSQGESANIFTQMFLSENHFVIQFPNYTQATEEECVGKEWRTINSDRTIQFNWKRNLTLYSCA